MTTAIELVSPSLVLDLPLLTQSQNTYQRSHWLERHKAVGRYRKLIGQRLAELLAFDPEAIELWPKIDKGTRQGNPSKRRVLVTRHSAGELDYGNLVGGCKPLIDALVREGVLYDDKPRWLEDVYRQMQAPKGKGRVVVEVWT